MIQVINGTFQHVEERLVLTEVNVLIITTESSYVIWVVVLASRSGLFQILVHLEISLSCVLVRELHLEVDHGLHGLDGSGLENVIVEGLYHIIRELLLLPQLVFLGIVGVDFFRLGLEGFHLLNLVLDPDLEGFLFLLLLLLP